MDLTSIRKSYRRYASVYDWMFGAVFAQGRDRAMERAGLVAGNRVLEVGVGTGLSLPDYPLDVEVVGVDVSREMLAEAQRKRPNEELAAELLGLVEMDAEQMSFADARFDVVVAMYVASVVPHPDRLFAEMWRVCRPGGRVLVINHFTSEQVWLRTLENALQPLARLVGFRPNMGMGEFIHSAGVVPASIEAANLGGYWKLLCFEKPASDRIAAAVAETSPAEAAVEPVA